MVMDQEITDKMCKALSIDMQLEAPPAQGMNMDEQMRFIKNNLRAVPHADRVEVGQVVIQNGLKDNFKPSSEGLILDLDKLPRGLITQMCEILLLKLEKLNKR